MDDISRHKEVFDPEKLDDDIHVIGTGATGSKVVLSLAKLGLKRINFYDFDIVEEHNLPNQAYSLAHVGKEKVIAMSEILIDLGLKKDIDFNYSNVKIGEQWLRKNRPTGYFFLCVDTMICRKELMEILTNPLIIEASYIIESRMGGDGGAVFSINPTINTDYEFWKAQSDYTDNEAEVSLCGTSISVGPTADIISATMVWQFMKRFNVPIKELIKEKDIKIGFTFRNNFEIFHD